MKTSTMITIAIVTQILVAAQENMTSPSSMPTSVPTASPVIEPFVWPPELAFLFYALGGAAIPVFFVEAYAFVVFVGLRGPDEQLREAYKSCLGTDKPPVSPMAKIAYYTLVWFFFLFQGVDSVVSYPWRAWWAKVIYPRRDESDKSRVVGCEFLCCSIVPIFPYTLSGCLSLIMIAAYPALVLTASVLLIGPEATSDQAANYLLGGIFLLAFLYAIPFFVIQCSEPKAKDGLLLAGVANPSEQQVSEAGLKLAVGNSEQQVSEEGLQSAAENSEQQVDEPKTCHKIVWDAWKTAKKLANENTTSCKVYRSPP